MRQLRRAHSVGTRYDGRFVQSIDGLEGGSEQGRPVDWFFYVNGAEATVGAADLRLGEGDSVWWDRRDWGSATHVPAVVGQWPQPFGGQRGRSATVQLECVPASGSPESPCRIVRERLEGLGSQVSESRAAGAPEPKLRVLVGEWRTVRSSSAAAALERGPGASGVYAKPAPDGRSISLLDPAGRKVRRFGRGTGLVAATATDGGGMVWIVSGVDASGVGSAAKALDSGNLSNRYALIVAPDGTPHGAPEVRR